MKYLLPIGTVLVAVCNPQDRPPPEGATPIVESDGPSWESGQREFVAEPTLQLGRTEGEGPDVFGAVASVQFLSGGRIGVADNRSDRVILFDSGGGHLATLGGPGEGPDEFRDPARLFSYPGDSVAVFDFGLTRTLVFPLEPGPSRVITGLHDDRRAPLRGVLKSGSLLSYQDIQFSRGRLGVGWDSALVVLVQRDGTTTRPIARLESFVSGAGPDRPALALAPRTILAPAEDGFYWARSDRYEIFRYDSLGTLQYVIRRPVEPGPLGSAERDEYIEGTITGARRVGGDQLAQRVAPQIRAAEFAETRPLFGVAFVDRDGRLWVSDVPWPSRYDPPQRWSVFSEQGAWLGEVLTPDGMRIQDARGDLVVGVWYDDLAVPYVRVYRMTPG